MSGGQKVYLVGVATKMVQEENFFLKINRVGGQEKWPLLVALYAGPSSYSPCRLFYVACESLSSEFLSGSVSGRAARVVSACTSSSSDCTTGESLLPSLLSWPAEVLQEEETEDSFCRSSACVGTWSEISEGEESRSEPAGRGGGGAQSV